MSDPQPPLLVFNGRVVRWEEATIHVWSETAIRATNAFEGLRAYWSADGSWVVPAWDAHMRRLAESLLLLRIPVPDLEACVTVPTQELIRALPYDEDLYLRPTVFVQSGRYGADETTGSYVVAFPQARAQTPPTMRCAVSTWRRASDLVSPPRAKVGAAYNALRLPRIEATARGFDEALLLNEHGQVAELTGACLMACRHGRVISPPATAGTLESITREACIELLAQAGIAFEERPMDRSELYLCDELIACGTLLEVAAVVGLDDVTIGDGTPGPVTTSLFEAYRARALDPSRPGSLVVRRDAG